MLSLEISKVGMVASAGGISIYAHIFLSHLFFFFYKKRWWFGWYEGKVKDRCRGLIKGFWIL